MNTTDLTPAQVPGAVPLAAVVPLSDLYPSPSNPRKHFDGLNELALSIGRKGVIQPLVVRTRETAQGRLEVVDGERRYRAAQQAGLMVVPVILRDELTDAEVLELQLENAIQRSDLTPLEEARGFKALLKSNPSKYSAAYIADRISRSERYVVDRMRLLDLRPALQSLLDAGRIGVAHAELLAKLTPDDQERAADPGSVDGYRRKTGGLWAGEESTLDFDELNDTPDRKADPYAGLKVVTVKELEAWIARHVRFDVERMAATAPLEFGRVAGQVATAAAQPGRKKKHIAITHDHHLADAVRDPSERVYGPRSWKRADGTVASVLDDRGRKVDAKTCEHSVLGLVTVGPEYGTAFQVCIARDVCTVHWGAEIKAKAKTKKLIETGQGAKVAAQAKTQRDKEAEAAKRREDERKAVNALYRRVYPALAEAVLGAIPAANSPAGLDFLWEECDQLGAKRPKTITTPDDLVRHFVQQTIEREKPSKTESSWINHRHELDIMTQLAALFGVDHAALVASAKQAIADEAPAPAKATKAAKAPKPAGKRR